MEKPICMVILMTDIQAVSYTHLDVYKRQLYDIVFIMKNYKEQIPELLIEQLRDSFQ